MTIAEISSRLCEIRCDLEELANECHDTYIDGNADDGTQDYYYEDLSERIQDCADAVAEIENETFEI